MLGTSFPCMAFIVKFICFPGSTRKYTIKQKFTKLYTILTFQDNYYLGNYNFISSYILKVHTISLIILISKETYRDIDFSLSVFLHFEFVYHNRKDNSTILNTGTTLAIVL